MKTIAERKAALALEADAIANAETRNAWAREALEKYGTAEKRNLLLHLLEWIKTEPGHGRDCNCGECD